LRFPDKLGMTKMGYFNSLLAIRQRLQEAMLAAAAKCRAPALAGKIAPLPLL